ncbi:MAG TPA: TIM barrel protein [Candidatus Acidoferrum sp.]|nr:TIM barrel protein [Candidatus Acidoferrum sp.]
MQKVLSTYLFISRKLTGELLGQIRSGGFSAVEVFCSRAHFDYASKQEVRALASLLEANQMKLDSLHAPTSKDSSATRESGQPLSICEVEKVRRIEAMDEFKRAIDVSEDLPFSRMVLHMGGSRETADQRKRDAAFSTLEHLVLHAHHAGVTLAVENTTSEMGQPSYLRAFVEETRLTGLRFIFDVGHANLADGPTEERLEKSFQPLKELVASIHLHDNHGDKDEHLPPYEGSIDWNLAIPLLKSAPAGDGALPVVLELKEKFGPEAVSVPEQLASAQAAFEKFTSAWNS